MNNMIDCSLHTQIEFHPQITCLVKPWLGMFEQEFGSQTMAQVVMQKSCFSGQRIDKPWFLNYNKDKINVLIKNDVDGEDVTTYK
jgi:hypothetical protein